MTKTSTSLLDIVKQEVRKLGHASVAWIDAREKDKARLDWLDHNATRMGLVADRMSSSVTAREAIDALMERERSEAGDTTIP
jgi:hypothetical protein